MCVEKKIAKELRKYLLSFDEGTSYIENVRGALFFVSKITFLLNFDNNVNCDINCMKKYLNKMKHFEINDVMLYDKYKEKFLISENLKDGLQKFILLMCKSFNFKDINYSILYEELITEKEKKELGQVYTPLEVVDKIIDLQFENFTITPKSKVLDPACGGGYFLEGIFYKVKKIFIENDYIKREDIDKYIIENVIYGNDTDDFSCFLSEFKLFLLANGKANKINISNKDFLLDITFEEVRKFQVIIGNPPYIGHKKIGIEYGKSLKKIYRDVFYDKADLSYCFFKAGIDRLENGGGLTFITSRYFLEAKNADKFRKYLLNNAIIASIEDYNGEALFKQAIVSPAIISIVKNVDTSMTSKEKICTGISSDRKDKTCVDLYVENNGNLCELEGIGIINKRNALDSMISVKKHYNNGIRKYLVAQKSLDYEEWVLQDKNIVDLYNKIIDKFNYLFCDIVDIKQGIITGCDRAFIVNSQKIRDYNLEKSLLKKWIKNSNICDKKIMYNDLYLIYSNLIDDEKKYPNTLKYLEAFRDKLEERRECRLGVRRWFDLQWCREINIFEREKIIFPYKSSTNRFVFDKSNFFCSADIYVMNVKNTKKDLIEHEYLIKYLNSKVFEFVFKCKAKKVGKNLFDYYPNKINKLGIYISSNEDSIKSNEEVNFYKHFELNDYEIYLIENFIN